MQYIRDELYTESRHQDFMEKYGVLIEGYDMSRLGKETTILIPFVNMIKTQIMCVMLICFLEKPYFTMFAFTYLALFWLSLQLYIWPS